MATTRAAAFVIMVTLSLVTPLFAAGPVTPQSCTSNIAVGQYDGLIAETAKRQPELVKALRQFPKGADLHNHLSGAVMPESYLAMGIADGDCFGPESSPSDMYTIAPATADGTCKENFSHLATAERAQRLKILESLSMYRYNYPSIQAGHDQFFATFGRFGAISGLPWNLGEMLARILQQAHRDNVSYVETMASFQSQAVGTLTSLLRQKYPDNAAFQDAVNYPAMLDFLMSVGLQGAVDGAKNDISTYSNRANAILRCGLAGSDAACGVSYAFLAAANRNGSSADGANVLARIFTQTAFSFLLASSDRRVVGVNLVSGEDAHVSMANFDTEMRFFSYFHGKFPGVNIALHAGELTPCFVAPGDPSLKEHIAGSLKAGAKRIGHGVSFAYLGENDKSDIASLYKQNDALQEIMFTSNAQILGVAGAEHPFMEYRRYGIPTAFSTDDEGVSHADFTSEWVYAVKQYGLTGEDLTRLARESLQHSFLAGEPLWTDLAAGKPALACQGVAPGIEKTPEPCNSFLANSSKALAQWKLESQFTNYFKKYGKLIPKNEEKKKGSSVPKF